MPSAGIVFVPRVFPHNECWCPRCDPRRATRPIHPLLPAPQSAPGDFESFASLKIFQRGFPRTIGSDAMFVLHSISAAVSPARCPSIYRKAYSAWILPPSNSNPVPRRMWFRCLAAQGSAWSSFYTWRSASSTRRPSRERHAIKSARRRQSAQTISTRRERWPVHLAAVNYQKLPSTFRK